MAVETRNPNENVFPVGAEAFNRFGIKNTRNENEMFFNVEPPSSEFTIEDIPEEEAEKAVELSWTPPVIPQKEGKQGFDPIKIADQGVVADENATFDYQGYKKAEEEKDKGKVKSLYKSI